MLTENEEKNKVFGSSNDLDVSDSEYEKDMDISDELEPNQSKNNPRVRGKDMFFILAILLTALISFGLGRLSKIKENKTPIKIENVDPINLSASAILSTQLDSNAKINQQQSQKTTSASAKTLSNNQVASDSKAVSGGVVGSKNGSKYHFPWCSGAQRISEANKIWFTSAEDARKAGYTPAGNCKGLE